jgi:hypothetical protein
VSRHPSPASGRPSRRGRVFAAAAIVLGLSVGPAAVGRVAAADNGSSVLDGTFVDVAFVGGGPGLTPDLLTLDMALDPSVTTVSLLRRTTGWANVASATVALTPASDGSAPWLIQLGADRFAVLSIGEDMTTWLTPVSVDRSAASALRVSAPTAFSLLTSEAGVADVDADGSPELILLGYRGSLQDPCLEPMIAVVELEDLGKSDARYELEKPASALDLSQASGAAFGEWDGKPGVDLLVHAY